MSDQPSHREHWQERDLFISEFGPVRGERYFRDGLAFSEAMLLDLRDELRSLRSEVLHLQDRLEANDPPDDPGADWWRGGEWNR